MELKVRLLEGKVQEETLKIQQKHDEMVQKVYIYFYSWDDNSMYV